MPAVVMDGKELAARLRADVAREVAELGTVTLATILVGDDPASHVYIDAKHKAAHDAGMETRDARLPRDTPAAKVLHLIHELNDDPTVHGILVQLPLPAHLDEESMTRAVAPVKDVDGLHPLNAAALYLGAPLHVPATPAGCLELLDAYGVELVGSEAVVIGRSELVGKPVAMMLLQRHCTVTICHSRTRDLAEHCRRADVIVAAVGRPGLLTADMVSPGVAVLDVGVTRTDQGIRGDVDPGVAEVAAFLTPMPGGTGPMTIAMLLRGAVKAARFMRGELAFPGL